MPIALARLLDPAASMHAPKAKEAAHEHVVVDAGAAALAEQLRSVPFAVSEGLQGFLKVHEIVKAVKDNAAPAALTAGLRLLVGHEVRRNASVQIAETVRNIQQLNTAMASLAKAESSVLLVLPYQPGPSYVGAATRMIQSLKPACVALTKFSGEDATSAPRPAWLPDDLPALALPWGKDGRLGPQGIEDLSVIADAMTRA